MNKMWKAKEISEKTQVIQYPKSVEKWDILEVTLYSHIKYENPFRQVSLWGEFKSKETCERVWGFYDGEGRWKIRFMPQETGEYAFHIFSNDPNMNEHSGSFISLPAGENNHGPVYPNKILHFSYADGTPFFVLGSTAYGWTYRPYDIRTKTLESFEKYKFNKIRMLLTPKYYQGEDGDVDISYEPECYPFEGKPGNFDFKRFIPAYFQNYERCLSDLKKRGIEADVILFHFYDFGHFGIDRMDEEQALFYLQYVIRRFSAFRNVWWSLANEYDVSVEADGDGGSMVRTRVNRRNWDVIGEYIKANDPYQHPRSIHNYPSGEIYPNRSWMTHVSYQHPNTYQLLIDLKRYYQKPVVNDEYQYEGNVKYEWGNSTPEEVVFSHWLSFMAGGYATHGEAIKIKNNRDIFWTYGGEITGESAKRIRFLKEIALGCSFQEMKPDWRNTDGINYFSISKEDMEYLLFFSTDMPRKRIYPGNAKTGFYNYRVEVFDVWNCKKIQEYEIHKQTAFVPAKWKAVKLTAI